MKAKFKVGDRVAIKNPHFRENRVEFGTIVYAPKTSDGSYRVHYDGGYFLNGRDVPQKLSEAWLSPAAEELEIA